MLLPKRYKNVYTQRCWQKKNWHFYTQKATNRDTFNTVYDHRYVSIKCDRAFRKRVIVIKTVQHEITVWCYFVKKNGVSKPGNGHSVAMLYIYICIYAIVEYIIISVSPNFWLVDKYHGHFYSSLLLLLSDASFLYILVFSSISTMIPTWVFLIPYANSHLFNQALLRIVHNGRSHNWSTRPVHRSLCIVKGAVSTTSLFDTRTMVYLPKHCLVILIASPWDMFLTTQCITW
jgi:hypothetical protein